MKRTATAHIGALVLVVMSMLTTAEAYEIPADSPVRAALEKAEAKLAAIEAIPDAQRTFENTLGALDGVYVQLRLDTEMIGFMAYVSTDSSARERGMRAEEDIRNWYVDVSKREPLYKAVKAYAARKGKLGAEQQRLLEHTLRDYRRAGMELSEEKRAELKELQIEENKLVLEFDKNIRADETRVPLLPAELEGVPGTVLANIPRSGELYLAGLDAPTYMGIMTHCEVESTRQRMHVIYKRKGGQRNVELLERVLDLRAQQAKLLGFDHMADYRLETRMAKNADTVLAFYEKLRPLVREKAKQDFAEFEAAKREHTGDPNAELQAWDQFFYENWLRQHKYAVDSEEVRAYFPMDQVLAGMFDVTSTIFGLRIENITDEARAAGRPFWHEDVQLYAIHDRETGALLGEFYMDPFPRPNKYGHFAQFGLYPRKVWPDESVQTPLVALVCNFPAPTADQPSLMTHDDVVTLFHEFGHALHSLLTQVRYGSFSGTATALDFVECPSQVMENWCWDADVLQKFARHYKTGEPLPRELLDAMIAAKNVGSGMRAERQICYGMTDLRYSMDPDGKVDTTAVGLQTIADCEQFPPVENTYFQAGFGHLMHYHAGYYGYLWSEVYARDMFTLFEAHGVLDPATGMKLREAVFARGGSVDEMQMLRAFLKREPQMDAFLAYLGLSSRGR
jgi:thimet oligopeptidase